MSDRQANRQTERERERERERGGGGGEKMAEGGDRPKKNT